MKPDENENKRMTMTQINELVQELSRSTFSEIIAGVESSPTDEVEELMKLCAKLTTDFGKCTQCEFRFKCYTEK